MPSMETSSTSSSSSTRSSSTSGVFSSSCGSITVTGSGMAAPPTATVARKLHAVTLPADFRIELDCVREGNVLYGGDPFVKVVLSDAQARALDRLQREAVADDGDLARVLTERNLAQPVPPPHTEP